MNSTSADMAALIIIFKHVGAVCHKMYIPCGVRKWLASIKNMLNVEQNKKTSPYSVETTATSAPSSH